MELTPEQEAIGKSNFSTAVSITRRDLLKGAAAGSAGLGALFFGYKELEGEPVKTAFIGTGDEGNVLITQHPEKYMDIVAIADLRPSNLKRAIHGDGNDARIGLTRKLGEEKTGKIRQFSSHKELLAAKDELGIEAVVIAVPLNQHQPIAMECLDAGLHVLSEKLMAHNIKQCKEWIRKAIDKNLLLSVGHQRHYSVLYDHAAHLVHSGTLGTVKFIRAQWHRNNSFPNSDQWNPSIKKEDMAALKGKVEEFGYPSVEHLVKWRLFNETGGGLMAELGSHQMDAASIFLGHVHPLAVQGYGGKNFYGVKGVGSTDKQQDPRNIDDHIYVTFEFPGPNHPAVIGDEGDANDIAIVTYSSINTNRFEPYGEWVYGSRGTIIMKGEKEALLYKEEGRGSQGGGPDQRLWVISGSKDGGPVLDAYETTSGAAKKADDDGGWGDNISRGYTEEMEHFCYAIRTQGPDYYPDGKPLPKEKGGLRCNGVTAMADAIMALTANRAMALKQRIEFKDEWFDFTKPDTPEGDYPLQGEDPSKYMA